MHGLFHVSKFAFQAYRRRLPLSVTTSTLFYAHRDLSTTPKHPVTKVEKIILDTIKVSQSFTVVIYTMVKHVKGNRPDIFL
jgi:hypothetical protein